MVTDNQLGSLLFYSLLTIIQYIVTRFLCSYFNNVIVSISSLKGRGGKIW